MRFSLRTLLLMFPAIVLSYGLALFYAQRQTFSESEQATWVRNDLANVGMQVAFIESQTRISKAIPNIPRINQLVNAPNNVLGNPARQFAWPHPCGRLDAWGQLYVAVALDAQNQPLPEVVNANKVGFFSRGQDGKSDTHGNDLDDLNSWRPSSEFYLQQAKRQASDRARIDALGLASVPLAAILGLVYFFRDPHLAEKDEPQTA